MEKKMKAETKLKTKIPEIPDISGLRFRLFQGESDYANILSVFNACKDVDCVDFTMTIESISHHYKHLERSNPYTDVLFAEADGKAVAFCRVGWYPEESGNYIYYGLGWVDPAWRRKGIGSALLKFIEDRSREMAAEHPVENKKFYQGDLNEERADLAHLFTMNGYEEVRWGYEMERPMDAPLPEVSLPEGLTVRPVPENRYRDVFDAESEAFRDHWGYVEPTEEDYKRFLSDPLFTPELWQVAWDGDQVAGMVRNFVNKEENEEYQRKRGYTENISVRRPYRRKGLASYLLVSSIKMFREMGMEETAHGVDSQNPNHALTLYEDVGYQVVKKYTTFRKPLILDT
jgi:ribosomal protein S18 acetylase RimI-like enzyme